MSVIKLKSLITPVISNEQVINLPISTPNNIIIQKVPNVISKNQEISTPSNVIIQNLDIEFNNLTPVPEYNSISTIILTISLYISKNSNEYDPVISSNTIILSLISLKFYVEEYLVKSNYLSEFKSEQEKLTVRRNLDILSSNEIILLIDSAINNLKEELGGDISELIQEIISKVLELENKVNNITSDDVKFTKDLVITSNVGVHIIPPSGYIRLDTTNKSLTLVMDLLFSSRKIPEITLPKISSIILDNSGSKEVGTTFTPIYNINFNLGSYLYDQSTGVTVTEYNVYDTNGNFSNLKMGNFSSFIIEDNTNYQVSATATYGNGNIPKDNLGNDYLEGQILAGTTSVLTSKNVTGFRKYFYGYSDTIKELNSNTIRNLQYSSTTKYIEGLTFNLIAPSGTKLIIIACISDKLGPVKILNNTITQTVTNTFTKTENILVEGYDGYSPIDYNIWTYIADIPYKNEVSLTVTLG